MLIFLGKRINSQLSAKEIISLNERESKGSLLKETKKFK